MRDLKEIFSIRRLENCDLMAMIWHGRGVKDGVCNAHRDDDMDLPKSHYLILEYEEGFTMGRCMALARMKPK